MNCKNRKLQNIVPKKSIRHLFCKNIKNAIEKVCGPRLKKKLCQPGNQDSINNHILTFYSSKKSYIESKLSVNSDPPLFSHDLFDEDTDDIPQNLEIFSCLNGSS